MPVHFSSARMTQVLEAHERWWKGTLDRPLAAVTLTDAYPAAGKAAAPLLSQKTCHELRWPAEAVIERLDEELSTREYLGGAFPRVDLACFGPGVTAAFCGAKLDNSSGGVWFFPREKKELSDIRIRYDPENVWVQRIRALCRAGLERWGGTVVIGMPDLGGVLDIVATFRGSQNLLTDLYDDPEEVLRLIAEAEEAWREAYADFESVLHPRSAGYTDWSGLLSREPSYIVQCDFCYMIGNAMFRQFVLPTLERDVQRLTNVIYHLDGIGELNHLDTILQIRGLRAVQWVFGEGQPGTPHWTDVYEKIRRAGKRLWLTGGAEDILETVRRIGGRDVYMPVWLNARQEKLAEQLLEAR